MTKIAYLLHRFPRITDTFIMRELRSLQKAGTPVEIISVWKPHADETTSDVIDEWASRTRFLLPRSPASIARILCMTIMRAPIQFVAAARLAFTTSRPGLAGLLYQLFYLVESALAAEVLRNSKITHVH